jgi:opacity protein-like surface antigen
MHKPLIFLMFLPTVAWALEDPCGSLLAVLNRPTVSDSVCVVKPGKIIIEAGTQYQDTYPHHGHSINLPEIQLRLGLPYSTEFTVLPPNYISPQGFDGGYGATVAGIKHQFVTHGKWTSAIEGLITFPTGADNLGSDGTGFALNKLVNYDVTDALAVELMVGVSTATLSTQAGGDRYTSFNPDLVISWLFTQSLQGYAEFYGQTKTAPHQGSGFNADAGIQYLPTDYIELDIEYGQRLSGELGYFSRYIGAGAGIRF